MLNSLIINSLDTFNIVYLWTIITKNNNNIFKLVPSVFILSILTTTIEHMELHFLIIYIIDIIVIKIIYKSYLQEIILGILLVLLVNIGFQLILFLFINKLIYDHMFKSIIIELIALTLIVIFSKINLSNKFSFKTMDNNIFIYLISICSVYVAVFKIIWNYDNNIILNNIFITSVITSILVISQILTCLYIVKVIKEKEKLKISNEYDEVINEIIQEIKQRQHDFINYKNTIEGIVDVVDEHEIKKIIKNYIKSENVYNDKINDLIYISNPIIRSIIYKNMCRAKTYNINFKYEMENHVLDHILSYHEISNLLNNLLNNAFDEVMKDDCIKKNIEIKILNKNEISHLIIKNQIATSTNIDVNEIFKRGYSTKNTSKRGYGLYNVQQITNSHKGNINVKLQSEEIIIKILF